ncbi:MAG: hypothetical protein CV089_08605 [Nitrospira sp. WS110]|nr:hypothetical protein [Nitrospira sp. WS110]
MYNTFYHFHCKPFALLPDSDFLYLGKTHRTAHSLLEYGLLSEAPFMVLTGDPGMGKTTLLQKVMAEHRESSSIGLLTNSRSDTDCLLPWILLALGLNYKPLPLVEAHRLFARFLSREAARNRRVVLIIDEAQNLGAAPLEELRLLSNMNRDKTLRLQIILSGQPGLRTLLRRVDMTQLAQRVVVDYHLQPFTEEEATRYIRHRLHFAGGNGSLFTGAACSLAYRLSRGNPRLINQVCDMALTYGFAEQAPGMTTGLLARALVDRRKHRILPLAEGVDLSALADSVDESEGPEPLEPPPLASPTKAASSSGDETAVPCRTVSRRRRGVAPEMSRDVAAAIEQFDQAAGDRTGHAPPLDGIGLRHRAFGLVRQALAAFKKGRVDQRASGRRGLSLRYLLGRTLELLEEKPEALKQYRLIFRSDRTFKGPAARRSNVQADRPIASTQHRFHRSRIGQAWKQVRRLLKPNG